MSATLLFDTPVHTQILSYLHAEWVEHSNLFVQVSLLWQGQS